MNFNLKYSNANIVYAAKKIKKLQNLDIWEPENKNIF